ncbi:hypothetical protein GGR56DRAFT_690090 [Xylariaceae sp. FL0804]|nr:hypothetical protein GGR56DRAFT_690090 [Xylariaceae sp. FL0804]
MASQAQKPKGILKKSTATASPATGDRRPGRGGASGARALAEQHARIIHSRREIEDQIADDVLELSHFPPSTPMNDEDVDDDGDPAAHPAPADAAAFKRLVRLFQPSDYEDLVEERNANGRCGFALCPRPRARLGGGGGGGPAPAYKLVNWGRADFGIVPRAELERWCSSSSSSSSAGKGKGGGQRCARRAMYVKVQLSETAAWERAGIPSIHIELLEEPKEEEDAAGELARDVENMKIGEAQEKAAQVARDLALERGDTMGGRKKKSVPVTIREKSVKMAAEEPTLDKANEAGHQLLEGHRVRFESESELAERMGGMTLEGEAGEKNQ